MTARYMRLIAGAAGLLAVAMAARAPAETRFTLDASASVGIATNPYLEYLPLGPDETVVTGTLSVTPAIIVRDATGQLRLSGTFTDVEYSKNYRTQRNYALNAGLDRQLTERLGVRLGASFDSSIVGPNSLIVSPIGGGVVDPGQPPEVGDITLNGQRQRRQLFRGLAGFNYQASEKDELSLDVSGAFTRYPSASSLREFDYYSETVGYRRRVSSHATIGASLGYSQTNYLGTTIGDGTVISPQLTASLDLDSRWSIGGSVGASLARIDGPLGKVNSTSLAGSFHACRKDEKSVLCVSANRSAMPTSFGGIRTQTGIGSSFNYRLGEHTNFDATANYSWASQPILGGADSVEYLSTAATVNRQFSETIFGFVSTGYADTYEPGRPRQANFKANAGVRLVLGERE